MSGEEIFKKRKRDEYEGTTWTKEKGTMIPAFLQKTYEIMHNQEYSKYVAWNSEKDAIHIIDPVNFAREVLPRYFKHSNFASFVRQLNMYGFHKTKQDPDWREFKHQYFKYGRPDLLQFIKRKSNSSMLKTIPLPDDDLPTQMAELQDRFDTLEQKYSDLQNKHQMLLSRMHSYEITEQDRINRDLTTRNCIKFLLNNAVEKGTISRSAVYQLLSNPRQDNMLTNIDGLTTNSNGQIPLIMNQPCDARLQGVANQLQQQQQNNNQQPNQQILPSQILQQPQIPTPQTAASLLQNQSLASGLPIMPNQQTQLQQQQQQLQQMQMNYGIEQQPDDMDPFYQDYSFSSEHNPNSAFSQPPLQVEEVSTVTHSIPNTPQLDPIASPYLDFDKPSDL